MPNYGFEMSVKDLTSPQIKQIENSIKSLGGTVQSQTKQMQESFGGLGEAAQTMGRYIVEAFSVYEIYNFGKELMNVATEFQSFTNVIKYSSNGIVDNSENINYLNDAITRLHLPMKQAYEQFSEMQAGMVGTGIQGDKLRKVFEGVAEAATVMHLNPDKFSRTTYALKEIGELGTVQMRQMRMLAIALPGAMSIASQSLGMTSEQFHKAMKGGQINSADFLPKFAAGLTKRFNPGLENAGKSLMSQINDEKNAVLKLMLDMGNSLEPLFLDILHTVKHAMEELKNVWSSLTGNSNFVESLKFIFDWAVKLVPIWAAYKGVVMGWSVATRAAAYVQGLFASETILSTAAITANYGALVGAKIEVIGFGSSLVGTTAATEGTVVAMAGLKAALLSTGIGAFVIGLGLVVEKLISMNEELDKTIDKKYQLSDTKDQFKSISDVAASIKERYSVFNKLDPAEKSLLASDVKQFIANTSGKLPVLNKRTSDLSNDATKNGTATLGDKVIGMANFGGYNFGAFLSNGLQTASKTKDAATEISSGLKSLISNFDAIKVIGQQIKAKGIKPSDGGFGGNSPGKENAINTSNLAGAAGGLGQAKTIIQHIGVVQQNNGVKESKDKTDEVLQKLIELINGFSDSANAM